MKREAILHDFLNYCRPGVVAKHWRLSDSECDVWRCPKNADETLEALANKYSRASLVRSGLVRESPTRTLELGGAFSNQTPSFIALRRDKGGPPFDLMSDNGSVSGRLPMFAACRDYRIAGDLARHGFLLLTFSFPDFVALRAVGLPAAPAVGLEHFSDKTARQFRKLLAPNPAVPESGPIRLVLVGWSPSNWSLRRPAGLDEVIDNLRATANSLVPQSIDDIYLWRPNIKQMSSIAECSATGMASAAVQAVVRSLNEDAVSLSPERASSASCPGLLESTIALQRELSRSRPNPRVRKRKLRAQRQAVQNELVVPLLKEAADETDPVERARLHTMAALIQVIPKMAASCDASIEESIAYHGLRGYEASPQVGELLKASDALYKLMRRK